jgi:hypothetical protein
VSARGREEQGLLEGRVIGERLRHALLRRGGVAAREEGARLRHVRGGEGRVELEGGVGDLVEPREVLRERVELERAGEGLERGRREVRRRA